MNSPSRRLPFASYIGSPTLSGSSSILAAVLSSLLLLSAVTAQANPVMIVRIYENYGEPLKGTFGDEYSKLAGTFGTPTVNFTNWTPYGLTSFAAIITGTLYAPVSGLYNQYINSSSFYELEGFGMEFFQAYEYLGGPFDFQNVGETPMEGYMPFTLFYQTGLLSSPNDLIWEMPTPWGGDPTFEQYPNASVQLVQDISTVTPLPDTQSASVPDTLPLAGFLIPVLLVGFLHRRTRSGRPNPGHPNRAFAASC